MNENISSNSVTEPVSVGIIGLGTVGAVLAQLFGKASIPFVVYDILLADPEQRQAINARAAVVKATLAELPTLIAQSSIIISTVTTQVAVKVANQCLPLLKKGQVYIDFNSTSPAIKKEIWQLIESGEAAFVEGVILNAVHLHDTTIHVLTAGKDGAEITAFLQSVGITARFYAAEIGKASLFKMTRSIFSKGLEALLLEMMVTARKAGIEKEIWTEITNFMDSKPFREIAGSWIKSHPQSCERRFHEMHQVLETMTETGVPPIMTHATLQYFELSVARNLPPLAAESSLSTEAVIDLIANYTNT